MSQSEIRNLAIVAHIDHGKTTLIDSIFRCTQTFERESQLEERMMDSHDLEKERGITIRAKHCSVDWNGHRFNIVDTPGHADFSGEVERVLAMVDSVLLLVDANEGPMPQTRYVLMRALALGMKPIVILNKVDRPHADPDQGLDKTFDLFMELGATDEQADFPILYGSGLEGWLVRELEDERRGLDPMFEMILEKVPAPHTEEGPFRMQISTLDYSEYVGRIGCGRILSGSIKPGTFLRRLKVHEDEVAQDFVVTDKGNHHLKHLWGTRGLDRVELEEAHAGDIIWLAGLGEVEIGETLVDPNHPEEDLSVLAFPPLDIEEPTVSMFFLVNSGPFSGQSGRAITIRELRNRLEKEVESNVALRISEVDRADGIEVSGRGELHLAILIEEMRREGMEFCVSRPEVITRLNSEGKWEEPIEEAVVDVPSEYQGAVIEKLARRKGELKQLHTLGTGGVRMEFEIPTRGLIGYRSEFLTDTRGTGILASRFAQYGEHRGEIQHRNRGSMISMAQGEVTSYAIESLQQRSTLFVTPGDQVYTGQVVGENSRPPDLSCNPTRKKQVTNHRSATKEIDTVLKAPRKIVLDQALEWIAEDELVEVTPDEIRIRKAILDAEERKRAEKDKKALRQAAQG